MSTPTLGRNRRWVVEPDDPRAGRHPDDAGPLTEWPHPEAAVRPLRRLRCRKRLGDR